MWWTRAEGGMIFPFMLTKSPEGNRFTWIFLMTFRLKWPVRSCFATPAYFVLGSLYSSYGNHNILLCEYKFPQYSHWTCSTYKNSGQTLTTELHFTIQQDIIIMKRCWLFSRRQLDRKETYLVGVSTGCSSPPQGERRRTGASGRNVGKISFFPIKLFTRE